MPSFLQAAGFACLAFAFTLVVRPKVRPSPATYAWAISVDLLCVLFTIGALIIWPAWWLLFPLMIWGAFIAVHVQRYRDARVMVRVLEANRAPLWAPRQDPPDAHDSHGWAAETQDRYRSF